MAQERAAFEGRLSLQWKAAPAWHATSAALLPPPPLPLAVQAVVFVLQHGPQGSLGLILNRPTSLTMAHGRDGLPLPLDVSWMWRVWWLGGGLLQNSSYLPSSACSCPALSTTHPAATVQGMEALRDAFAESRLYCGGFRAQQVWRAACGAGTSLGAGAVQSGIALSCQRHQPFSPHRRLPPQVVTLLHGQRRLEGAVEVVPGIYAGAHEAAVAEVATGGLRQVGLQAGARCEARGQTHALVAEACAAAFALLRLFVPDLSSHS